MAKLSLIDFQTQREIGTREMAPEERHRLYEDCRDHGLISFQSALYHLKTVCWNPKTEECLAQVTFHAYEAGYCDC